MISDLLSVLNYDPGSGQFRWACDVSNRVHAGDLAGCLYNDGYVRIQYRGKSYGAHNLAYIFVNGHIPDGMEVDHINRNPSDNRISNLRACTRRQNARNRRVKPGRDSGVVGVRLRNGKWAAYGNRFGKQVNIGYFQTKGCARLARKLFDFQEWVTPPTEGVSG